MQPFKKKCGQCLQSLMFILLCSILGSLPLFAQQLKLKQRKANALTGSAFASSISRPDMSLAEREKLIFKEIKNGNIPGFLRNFKTLHDSVYIDSSLLKIEWRVLPDYLAIGSNDDYFYVPLTPMLAQKIANLLKCSLPTRKMVDLIYQHATIKLEPLPIPPTKAMTSVPVFIDHNEKLKAQIKPDFIRHQQGELTAGHKKDVVISNKIYEATTPKVVIYGWHQLNGKAIQPLYAKHTNTWADYSHGIRLIDRKVRVNGKQTSIKAILNNPVLMQLLSDEGLIKRPYYPRSKY